MCVCVIDLYASESRVCVFSLPTATAAAAALNLFASPSLLVSVVSRPVQLLSVFNSSSCVHFVCSVQTVCALAKVSNCLRQKLFFTKRVKQVARIPFVFSCKKQKNAWPQKWLPLGCACAAATLTFNAVNHELQQLK